MSSNQMSSTSPRTTWSVRTEWTHLRGVCIFDWLLGPEMFVSADRTNLDVPCLAMVTHPAVVVRREPRCRVTEDVV